MLFELLLCLPAFFWILNIFQRTNYMTKICIISINTNLYFKKLLTIEYQNNKAIFAQ